MAVVVLAQNSPNSRPLNSIDQELQDAKDLMKGFGGCLYDLLSVAALLETGASKKDITTELQGVHGTSSHPSGKLLKVESVTVELDQPS
jgi:hypothetical protein